MPSVIYSRPEFKYGLHKSSHNLSLALADIRHFEHHTEHYKYIMTGTNKVYLNTFYEWLNLQFF